MLSFLSDLFKHNFTKTKYTKNTALNNLKEFIIKQIEINPCSEYWQGAGDTIYKVYEILKKENNG